MSRSMVSSFLRSFLLLSLLFAGLAIAETYLAHPAMALTDCSTASAPCAEDPVIGDNNLCTGCHNITVVAGNRNGSDRPITKSTSSNRHILSPRANWTSTVSGMVGKGAGGGACDATCIAKAAAFLNSNYCVGCNGPILGSVTVSGIDTTVATIGWATDVPATSCVIYGTTDPPTTNNTCNPSDPSYDPTNATMTQGHSVAMHDLTPNTTYYAVHQSTAASGTGTYTLARKFTTLEGGLPPPTGGPGTIISLATGDYNGDANPDLAIGVSIFNYVISYLGNGSGGFTEGQTLNNVGVKPLGITTGGVKADFDGDNVADLAVANFGEVANDILANANVAIFLGTGAATPAPNPNNAFATTPVSIISLDASATAVAAGDFNRDGHMDLAVATVSVDSSTGSVRIFLGDGTGHFAATPVATIPVKVKPPTITITNITNPDCLSLPANVTVTGTKLTDSAEYLLDDAGSPLQVISFAEDGTSVVLRIPATATAGSHQIVAHLGADSASGPFTVNPRTVTISAVSPSPLLYSFDSSRSIAIQGSGFVVGSTITVQGPGGTLSGTAVSSTGLATATTPFVFNNSTLLRFWWGNTSLPPGSYDVTVTNTDNCAGTVTAAGAFVITAPQPTVSNTATSPLTYGVSLNQSVSVFGSNFMSGATVTLGTLTGVTVPGTIATATTPYVFVSSTTIRVWWPNTSMPPGSYTAMVTNPAAAGGLTGTLTNAFVVAPPQPTISSVSPASLTYGVSPSQSVSVFGSNFMVGDTVQVDGISCVTVSGTIATATVPCVVVTGSTTTIRFWWNSTSLSPGAQDVTVISPIAAGGLSATLPGALTILPATPAVSSISPTTVTYGITLGSSVTIFGSGFINGAAITVGGLTGTTVPGSVASATVPFVFVSSTQVKFWWPNTSLAPGDYAVTVTNPVASGGLSSTLPAASGFHVVAPQPTVISTTPASVIYGVTANQSVTISGDNFILGAVINVSGLTGTTVAGSIASATTPFVYVSKNTLRFWWSNTSLSLGAHAVQVTNPAVAGGLSATLAGGFTVTAPQPTVTAASPTSVVYGISTSQSITISGSNFVLGSTITVGGLTGTTVTGSIASAATPYVFVNNSTVRFWWPNTSLTTGAYAAQVTNPAAAGGLGATLAAAFTVTGPQPTITSLSLPTATYGVTSSRSVTISGGNFLVGSTITVQGPGGTLSGVTVSGSTATASVPFVWTSSTQVKFWWGNTSLPAGTYDVIVTNPAAGGGLSTTLVGGFVIN